MGGISQTLINWDRATFLWVNHDLRGPFLDAVMPRISDLGLGHIQVLLILSAAVLLGIFSSEVHLKTIFSDLMGTIHRRRHWVGPLILAFAISGLSAMAVKHAIDRDRPWWFYEHEHEAGRQLDVRINIGDRGPLKTHGFLSGHTATTFALATALALVFRKRREKRMVVAIGWISAVLIMFSRVYIVDHWPLDCIAGAILGVGSGFVAFEVCKRRAAKPIEPGLDAAIMVQHV